MDDENNYSTVYDISIILKYALANEIFKQIFITDSYTTSNGLILEKTIVNGVDYLLVTLGADNYSDYINDAINAYDYYSNNYEYKTVLVINQFLIDIPIKNGKEKSLSIYSKDHIDLYLPNEMDLNELEYEYEGVSEITKDIKVNDKLGVINITYHKEILATYDIYLTEKIEYKNSNILKVIIVFVFIVIIIKTRKNKIKKSKNVITKKNKKCYNYVKSSK